MAHISKMPTVHIVSDGTPENTRVLAADGTEIRHVRALNIRADAGDPFLSVELEISPVEVHVDGTVTRVIVECPVCQLSMDHMCRDTV